ncbi:hypothetical protein HGA88_02505 [Candidatus Roizmanbacteria bacterium]|nr:hypothetical protein [Candidatus Roizmanbacteria bacterium]
MDDTQTPQTKPEDIVSDSQEVSEAEIVVESTEDAVVADSSYMEPENEAMTMLKLDSLIKRYISSMKKMKEELKTQQGMFKDAVTGDATFNEQDSKAKEATRLKNAAKQNILKQPAVVMVKQKIEEIKEELKDTQDALGDYLSEYERISGATEIEDEEGELHSIVKSIRLVKKGRNS